MAVTVDAVKLMADVTLTVKLRRTHELRARAWLAGWLIRLAGWVLGCNVRIEGRADA